MDNIHKMLEDLSSMNCISGDETDLFHYIVNVCSSFSKVEQDPLNNIYIKPLEKRDGNAILLEAHGDEVGFIIQSINKNGTLNFINVGGIRRNTFSGSDVFIKKNDGTYTRGTIVSKKSNIEFPQTKDYNDSLIIDIGAISYEDAIKNFNVDIGNTVTPVPFFYHDVPNGLYWGKAFDNRIGCVALLKTIESLEKCRCNYIGIISAQEEVGSRGIRFATKRICEKVTEAICFEGALANDNYFDTDNSLTALKRGPILRQMDKSMICNHSILKKAMTISTKKKIPYQCSVKNSGGTDAAIIYNEFGIPTVVIGIPVRHIHTFSCIASSVDLEYSIELAIAIAV